MTELARRYEKAIVDALAPQADPIKAEPMAACLRDLFTFCGVQTPQRRAAMRSAITGLDPLTKEGPKNRA